MKPKTKLQKKIVEYSHKLPKISDFQKKWAYKNCFKHIGRRTKDGVTACLECGKSWYNKTDDKYSVCPHCSTKLQTEDTRKRVFKQTEYICIITTYKGFQVLRFYYVDAYYKVGKPAYYFISEVVQRWIAPNGKYATLALLRPISWLHDTWQFSSSLELRPEKPLYDIVPTLVYSRQSLSSAVKQRGFKGELHDLTPFEMLHSILSENRAETLLKSGQMALLRHFVRSRIHDINYYWTSICICNRNEYIVDDSSTWCDYIDQLRFFGKDLHNAKYVCPENLRTEHDRYMKKRREHNRQVKVEQQRRIAIENESQFRKLKSKFFGISFTDGTIQVRVLESVYEFFEESDKLHHCLSSGAYFLKPNSLILSATVNGERVETVEISLETMKVMQSRGAWNGTTEYHDQIIKLVNKNIKQIRRNMVA